MESRSGKRRETVAKPGERESDFDTRVQQLSGWSRQELTDLLTKRAVPDHWNGTPCFALMEAIRHTIFTSCEQSYTELFPAVFETLKWKPNSSISSFLTKLKRMVQRAQSHDILWMLSEFGSINKETKC